MLRTASLVLASLAGIVIAVLGLRRAERAAAEAENVPIQDQIDRALADPLDGWWVAEVLDAFGYLEPEFGYRLTKVYLHFRGTSLWYEGPVFDFVIEHDPDDTGSIHADLWVHQDRDSQVEPMVFAVNDVLRARDPGLPLPDPQRSHLEKAEVLEAITIWAVGLRELAPDILRGAWPDGVWVGHPW